MTEMDLSDRLQRLPGAWQNNFTPFAGNLRPQKEGVTLSTKAYPSWHELAAKSKPYQDV